MNASCFFIMTIFLNYTTICQCMNKIIALVGMTGAGKSELAMMFEAKGFHRVRFGDITEEILKNQGLPINEENEKMLKKLMRSYKNILQQHAQKK